METNADICAFNLKTLDATALGTGIADAIKDAFELGGATTLDEAANWCGDHIEVNMETDVCENCGTTEGVEWCLDPYEEEINGKRVECFLCYECYQEYCDDI